jgi:nickel transport protein
LILFVFLGLMFATAVPLSAHRVNVFAYFENDTVHVEAYAQDGSPIADAELEIQDPSGSILYRTRTDGQGLCSFRPADAFSAYPAPENIVVVLNASEGHRAEYELGLAGIEPPASAENGAAAEKTDFADVPDKEDKGTSLTPETVRSIVREEMARQLAPITRELARMQQDKVTASDVFAGIGYILGLAGIAMIVYSRKRSGKNG